MPLPIFPHLRRCAAMLLLLAASNGAAVAAERTEHFDQDPGWDGHNNRPVTEPRPIRQDFGFSPTTHAGGTQPGEVGGFIQPAAEKAYYAKVIPEKTYDDVLTASGKVVCAGKQFHVLVGFFNANTLNEWRTPNSIVIRLQGRGDIFFAYVEYTTSRWRSGGDSPGGFSQVRDTATGRMQFKGFPSGAAVHRWSLRYDPRGHDGTGSITVTFDDETSICHLDAGHKTDGATFNRCGLLNVMKQFDDGGEVWFDDFTVDGQTENFDRDPGWDAVQNRRTYATPIIRPRFDFGYSDTKHAGGKLGELGGLIFRGDGRYPEKMAFYGDRLEALDLTKPLRASGKVSLRRAVTDSDILFGFFHAEHSLASGGSDAIGLPPDFLGATIGGPSSEGFMFSPAYRLHNTERASAPRGPYLLPNSQPHDWTIEFTPSAEGGAVLVVSLDGEKASLPIPREHLAIGAHYNRFGLISTHTDGNGQHLYFDDLSYTWTQAEPPPHRTLRGHTGSVLSLAYSPDGRTLASGCRDKTVRLWDVATGELRQTLAGHSADVYAVAFSPDGQTLASGAGDRTIRLWNPSTGAPVRTIEAHDDLIRAVVFSPDGKTVASTGADLSVRLWDSATWKRKSILTGHERRVKSLAFTPDGRFLASGGDDRSVRIWDVASAALATTWVAHLTPIETLVFSPDGSLLATSSNDGTVRLWHTGTWQPGHVCAGHRGEVDSVAFAPDGATLASGSKDRALRLWDPRTGALLAMLPAHDDRIESLAFSPRGDQLATGSGGQDATIKLWSTQQLRR